MNEKKDFPGYKTIGRHSNYSRYKTCNPLDIGSGFDYHYDPEDFPKRDDTTFRVITLNCNRFPRTLHSEAILTCLLFASLPDMLILQEVKAIPVLNDVVQMVTSSELPGTFGIFAGKEYSSGLNIASVYRLDTLDNSVKSELFKEFHIQNLYSLRRPINVNTFFNIQELDFLDLHLVSRSQREHVEIRGACLEAMQSFFELPGNDSYMIMGGDWNIDSDSDTLYNHFENFNIYIDEYDNSSDHFLVSKALIDPRDINRLQQYKLPIEEYLQLSEEEYTLYMSDHFPVVLDIPTLLLT